MAEFIKVAQTHEIKKNESISIKAGDVFIALGNNEGEFFAVSDICPHAGLPVGGGWVEDGCIVCPHHYWMFDTKTGKCPHVPEEKITTYEVKVVGRDIYVKI